MREVYPNELYHYGIMGQKWGIRRFQNPDGTLTAAGRKRYGTVQNLMAGRTQKQAAKIEQEKQAAIRSGKVKKIQKYSSEMSKAEIKEAIERINTEQELAALRIKDKDEAHARIQEIISTGKQVKDALELAKNAYNLTAEVHNAFAKDGKKMPVIGEKKDKIKPADAKILYDLNEKKTADERSKWFEEELRNHDANYFKENASKFSTSELKAVQERFSQTSDMFGSNKPDKVSYSWKDQINWPSNEVKNQKTSDITLTKPDEILDWANSFMQSKEARKEVQELVSDEYD